MIKSAIFKFPDLSKKMRTITTATAHNANKYFKLLKQKNNNNLNVNYVGNGTALNAKPLTRVTIAKITWTAKN